MDLNASWRDAESWDWLARNREDLGKSCRRQKKSHGFFFFFFSSCAQWKSKEEVDMSQTTVDYIKAWGKNKNASAIRETEYWSRLPREDIEYPSLEAVKT